MSNLIKSFFAICILFVAISSCKKDGDMLTLNSDASFPAGITASADSVVLTSDLDNDSVLTIHWGSVNYGQRPVVNYTVQFDVPSDTSGSAAWGNAKSFQAGAFATSYSFEGKDLNSMLNAMGIAPDLSTPIVFRVISNITQYNGSASSVPSVYSSSLIVPITAYALSLYVPGDYQGWNPATAPLLNPVTGVAGKFEGYYYMPGTGPLYFKYTNAPDFNHINYGDSSIDGLMTSNGLAGGLYTSAGGYIEVTADFNTQKWTATTTTWGIIGDATPGLWNTDTQLTYDPVAQVWSVTVPLVQAGSFKFRANNAWNIDFGVDGNGNLQYADNPFFTYNPNLNNLTVPSDGTYKVTLDLHVSGKYNYSIVKQ